MGKITIGSVVLFQSFFDTIINSVQKVLDRMPQITQGYDSLASVNEILFEKDMERNGTQKLPAPVRGEIEVKDLVFSYADEKEPTLNGVSFHVPAGKCVAFVAKSGEGKSTLLNLIVNRILPTNGTIKLGNDEINDNDAALNYISTARVMEEVQEKAQE